MKILNSIYFFNKNKTEKERKYNDEPDSKYKKIGQLLKEARIQKNLTIEELSHISKIPEQTINSIENNIENLRPKYPFIRSILIKLEKCLEIKKNSLLSLIIKEKKTFNKHKRDLIISKFDILNTWQGSILYFLILILTIYFLEKHFISNPNIIEIKGIDYGIEK